MKRANILCVRESELFNKGRFEGFQKTADAPFIQDVFSDLFVWFGPREHLEKDESFKQIIPYVLIRAGDKVGLYTRASAGEEERLHNMRSIGF
jgi:predicted NUDIX family phosphoesterase